MKIQGRPTQLERRVAARRPPAADEPLACARLRTGRECRVVNLSNSGALLESAGRLLPGTHVDIHLVVRDGRMLVRGRVLRAFVCELSSDGVRYRAAVAFDHPVDTAAAPPVPPMTLPATHSGHPLPTAVAPSNTLHPSAGRMDVTGE